MFEALWNLWAKRSSETPPPGGEEEILAKEYEYIRARRTNSVSSETKVFAQADAPAPADAPLAGLALSGGGVRSAIYCLGVLQKLAAAGILEKFDYLSTVSGGGYIGGSLTWFLHRQTTPPTVFDCGNKLPFGTDDPTNMPLDHKTSPLLKHLQNHGSYLIPGKGITIWSGIAVVLRGILVNLLTWVPVAAVILLIMAWVSGLIVPPSHQTPDLAIFLWLAGAVAVVFLCFCIDYSWQSGRARNTTLGNCSPCG